MNVTLVSSWIVGLSLVASIGTYVYMKRKKILIEKSFVYGVVGAIGAQLLSIFILAENSFFTMIIDAMFLAMIFYNIVIVFGIRFSKIHESHNSLLSFYGGIGVIGNLLNFLFFGLSGLMIDSYSKNPEIIEAMGEEMMQALIDSVTYALSKNISAMIASLLAAIIISYFSINLFARGFAKKLIRTNFKSLLMLFAYYLVGVYMPANTQQIGIQVVLYIAVVLASYLIYQQSKHDEPSVIIKVIK